MPHLWMPIADARPTPAPRARRSRAAVASVAALALLSLGLVTDSAPAANRPDGTITGLAGTGAPGFAGDGGPAAAALLRSPRSVAVGIDGSVYVADTDNHRIRRVAPDGTITTVAGTGVVGFSGDGGPATAAQLDTPHYVSVDVAGNVIIADSPNHRIRRLGLDGVISTIAGTGVVGFSGDGGPATAAALRDPKAAIVGPDGALYISDTLNHRIRRVDGQGVITTFAGDGTDAHSGDDGPAAQAALRAPRGLAFDADGNLYVADNDDARVRRITPGGIISTVAGSGVGAYTGDGTPPPDYDGDGVPATEAALSDPRGVAVDHFGNLFIADTSNSRIRMVDPQGTIWTVAGTGTAAPDGDGGAAVYSSVSLPRGLTVDAAGAVYIADTGHHRIRKLAQPRPAPPGLWVGNPSATVETPPVAGAGDAADDPAIWVDPSDPSRSVVIGTDKATDALEVYDLSGHRLQRIVDGFGVNNVDVRTGFRLGGEDAVIVTVAGQTLRFYRLDPVTRTLTNVTKGKALRTPVGGQGLCMYRSPATGRVYAFPNNSQGLTVQLELVDSGGGLVDATVARGPWDIHPGDGNVHDGEVEGCTVDDATGRFYISEQAVGIWEYGAEPSAGTGASDRTLVDSTDPAAGGHLVADVEGLAVVPEPDGDGFLIASNQSASTYSVYRRESPHAFVRTFTVVDQGAVDGCSFTDGIEATPTPLGDAFPNGMFVCQDNLNTNPSGPKSNQNFKLVPLERVVPLDQLAGGVGSGGPTTSTSTTTTTRPAPTTTTTTRPAPTTTTTTRPAPTTTTTSSPGTPTSTQPVPSPGTGGPTAAARSGYRMLGSDGVVYPFGDARALGDAPVAAGTEAVDLESIPAGDGYWVLRSDGQVASFGTAPTRGSVGAGRLASGERASSLSATPSGLGYWVFTNRGRALPFGDATFFGDLAGASLGGPVVGSVATPSGRGYYMVGSDGGVFAFGDAVFAGSMGGRRLNAPVRSLVPDGDGAGYWLVGSDGGIFAFSAPFRGSMGGKQLNQPVSGMVRSGNGYLMVAADGGIFSFSDQPFAGSLGARPPARPVVAVATLGSR